MSEDESLERRPRDPEAVDRWLRDALAPTPEEVVGVVRHALSSAEQRTVSEGSRRLIAAGLMIGVLAGGVFLVLKTPWRDRHREPTPAVVVPTITNAAGKVELRLPPGWDPRKELAARKRGGPAPAKILNAGGCVAVALPRGPVRYCIIGGGA